MRNVNPNVEPEATEWVTISIAEDPSYLIGTPGTTTVTISDDDTNSNGGGGDVLLEEYPKVTADAHRIADEIVSRAITELMGQGDSRVGYRCHLGKRLWLAGISRRSDVLR